MTKLKSKKMTKSTFAIIIMAIAMVAMLAFGGTYAYFTATNTAATTKDLTTGKVVLGVNEIASATTTKIVTNTVIASGVTVESNSNVDTWVVVQFSVKFDGTAASEEVIDFTVDNAWGTAIAGTTGSYYVQKVTGSEDTKTLSVCEEIKFVGDDASSTDKDGNVSYTNSYMDKTIEVSVQSWAVQAHDVADANAALVALGLKTA